MKPKISLLIEDDDNNTVAEIPLDVRDNSTYKFTSEVTNYPVEGGSTISDNVRHNPDEIQIEGFVSDSPIVEVPIGAGDLRGDSQLSSAASSPAAPQMAYDMLRRVWSERVPVTVVAEYDTFEDMIIAGLDIPRTKDTGLALRFTMQLKHITTVSPMSATLPDSVVKKLKRKNRPKVTAEQAAEIAKFRSMLQAKAAKGAITKEQAQTMGDNYAKSVASSHKR